MSIRRGSFQSASPFDSPWEARPLDEPGGLEAELLCPTPRRTRYCGEGIVWWLLCWFPTGLALAGAFISSAMRHLWHDFRRAEGSIAFSALLWLFFSVEMLRQRALIIWGFPVRARIEAKGIENRKYRWLDVSFVVPSAEGVPVRRRCSVSADLWNEVSQSDDITVLFHARRPKQSAIYRALNYRVL